VKWVEPWVRHSSLAVLLVVCLTEYGTARHRAVLRSQAAPTMKQAITRFAAARAERGIPFAREDSNHTGIIGDDLTPLVTTPALLPGLNLAVLSPTQVLGLQATTPADDSLFLGAGRDIRRFVVAMRRHMGGQHFLL
jgi:hypothetical protein